MPGSHRCRSAHAASHGRRRRRAPQPNGCGAAPAARARVHGERPLLPCDTAWGIPPGMATATAGRSHCACCEACHLAHICCSCRISPSSRATCAARRVRRIRRRASCASSACGGAASSPPSPSASTSLSPASAEGAGATEGAPANIACVQRNAVCGHGCIFRSYSRASALKRSRHFYE